METQVQKYIHSLSIVYPDKQSVKNIEIDSEKINSFTFLADSLINGSFIEYSIGNADVIGVAARDQKRKFETVMNECIRIINNCNKTTSKIFKREIEAIKIKDFDEI